MGIRVKHKETGIEAVALRWNLHAMSELIIGYDGEGGMDTDFSRNWVCKCHGLPLGEGENGQVLCKEADNG